MHPSKQTNPESDIDAFGILHIENRVLKLLRATRGDDARLLHLVQPQDSREPR